MAEQVWLYDVAGVQVACLADPAGLELDERLQEAETLRFTVRADDPLADYLDDDRVARYRSRRYRITELSTVRDGSAVRYEVAADALWIDLLGFPALAEPITGVTASQGLEAILADTPWTVGDVEADGGTYSLDPAQDGTALALVRAWAAMTGREVEFDTNAQTVSLVLAQGTDRGLGFRYGRNLISVTRKSEPPVATRLYAYGGGDLSIASVHPDDLPYVEDFSYYTDQGIDLATAQAQYLKVRTWTDERYLLALNLYDAALAKVATLARPTVSYELSVVDLANLVPTLEQVELGDTVRVDDAPTGIQIATRVVRKVTRPLEPARTEVELSYLQPGIESTASTSSSSSSSGGELSQLVALNASTINVAGGGQAILDQIDLGVNPGGQANLIFGFELDATATGTGTVQVAFFYGATQVGPTVLVPFVAGPVHVSVADFLVGLTTSASFYAKATIASGSGSLSVPANAAHMYVLGSGLAGGGGDSSPNVDIAEAASYVNPTADAGAVTALYTPLTGDGTETVDTTPTEVVSETVSATTAVQAAYRASATAVGTAVASQDITVPAAVQDGDLLLLAVATPSAVNHTTPAGWTLVRSDTGTGTANVRQSIYKRAASGDAGAIVACGLSGASNVLATVVAYLGNPAVVNVDGVGTSGANGTTATAPSVTTTAQWALLVDFYATVATAGLASITPPATIRVDHDNAATLAQAVSELARPVPGATGTRTATQTSGSWVAHTIAIA